MSSTTQECPSQWASLFSAEIPLTPPVVILGSVFVLLLYSKLSDWHVFYMLSLLVEFLLPVPLIDVEMTAAEAEDDGVKSQPSKTTSLKDPKRPGYIQCYDPSTRQRLGEVVAMTSRDVHELCIRASRAQTTWCQTSFAERRRVLRTIQRYIVHHVEDICRVCARDSGKPKLDALLGEILTTCEKIRCLNINGELWLRPSVRPTGPMMVHKKAYVEYMPLGVVGVIAPWNYPVRVCMCDTMMCVCTI